MKPETRTKPQRNSMLNFHQTQFILSAGETIRFDLPLLMVIIKKEKKRKQNRIAPMCCFLPCQCAMNYPITGQWWGIRWRHQVMSVPLSVKPIRANERSSANLIRRLIQWGSLHPISWSQHAEMGESMTSNVLSPSVCSPSCQSSDIVSISFAHWFNEEVIKCWLRTALEEAVTSQLHQLHDLFLLIRVDFYNDHHFFHTRPMDTGQITSSNRSR